MATSNFAPVKFGLPLIVGGISDDEIENDFEFEDTQAMLDEFNATLDHFEVYLLGGYYCGYQFMVKQSDEYWDYEDLADMTDDDADYYYGDTVENIRKEFEQDLKNIKEYLYNLKANGFMELAKVAQFSNGEALYKEVA